jgi:uncharacterized protein (DUF1697 family)
MSLISIGLRQRLLEALKKATAAAVEILVADALAAAQASAGHPATAAIQQNASNLRDDATILLTRDQVQHLADHLACDERAEAVGAAPGE